MSEREATELDNLVGGGRKRRGCCNSHPVLCGVILCTVVLVSLAVAICGAVFHSTVDHAVQDAIEQVHRAVILRCEGVTNRAKALPCWN